jgi:hypothetical protein
MKFFPVKTMILCLILPPVIYISGLNLINNKLEKTYIKKIKNIILLNTESILEGYIEIENAVSQNLEDFKKNDLLIKNSVIDIETTVSSSSGKILYPSYTKLDNKIFTNIFTSSDEIAKRNYSILSKGLNTEVSAELSGKSKIFLISFLTCLSVIIFFSIYYRASKKAEKFHSSFIQKIDSLKKEENNYRKILNELKNEKNYLFEQINKLNKNYNKTKINEEEMFEEIISLEEKLHSYIEFKKNKQEEIKELKKKLEDFEQFKTHKRKKNSDFMVKRFETIYKNITMSKKSLEGFSELEEDLKIKAEEMIHLLNESPEKAVIKRKVFSGKKNRNPSFEVIFGYSGRLYFSRSKDNKIEILTIGTKKTQHKDLDYLQNV